MRVSDDFSTIVVAVVAGVRLHGEGLCNLLKCYPNVAVTETALPDEELLGRLRAWQPDVVVLDAGPKENLLAAHRIARDLPAVRVAAFSDGSDEQALAYAEAGVLGFLEPGAAPADLNDVVHAVSRNEAWYPQRLVAALIERVGVLAASGEPQLATARLTRRETQIIELLGNGLSNREIAAVFQVELATVKNHVHNILKKLKVHSRADAVLAWRASEDAPQSLAVAQ
jgi:two-component system, NarL family, nitrate/nitrite response regulator NarL